MGARTIFSRASYPHTLQETNMDGIPLFGVVRTPKTFYVRFYDDVIYYYRMPFPKFWTFPKFWEAFQRRHGQYFLLVSREKKGKKNHFLGFIYGIALNWIFTQFNIKKGR